MSYSILAESLNYYHNEHTYSTQKGHDTQPVTQKPIYHSNTEQITLTDTETIQNL